MNNLVSRDTVIDTLRTTSVHISGVRLGKLILPQYEDKCREAFIKAVLDMPQADAEYVHHGYWIDMGKSEKGSSIIQCSVCGKTRKGTGKSKYCRDCGAKMDATAWFVI